MDNVGPIVSRCSAYGTETAVIWIVLGAATGESPCNIVFALRAAGKHFERKLRSHQCMGVSVSGAASQYFLYFGKCFMSYEGNVTPWIILVCPRIADDSSI